MNLPDINLPGFPRIFPHTSSAISIFPEEETPTEVQGLLHENELLRAKLKGLANVPFMLGWVLDIEEREGDPRIVFTMGPGTVCERKAEEWMKGARAGMVIRCVQGPAGAIPICFAEAPPGKGAIVVVTELYDDVVVFEGPGGVSHTVACAIPVKPGDRVVLNPTEQVVVAVMPPKDAMKKGPTSAEQGVEWDDVGGLADAKQKLREAIEEPVVHKAVYDRFGKKRVKGIALFGPPGTGKTLLARACATSLARTHGKSASETGFIFVKGPEILNHFVGKSEENIRNIFAQARAHAAAHGYPALVFIDEADALISKRGATIWGGMERTIVPQFLAEMDSLDESGALVLFATNRPEAIDTAFLRDGRIDRKIEIGRPSKTDAVEIFDRVFRGKPVAGDRAAFFAECADLLFDPRRILAVVQVDGKGRERVTLGERCSGAMCLGVAERATQRAIRRALATDDAGGCVTLDDVRDAVGEVLLEEQSVGAGKDAATGGNVRA